MCFGIIKAVLVIPLRGLVRVYIRDNKNLMMKALENCYQNISV